MSKASEYSRLRKTVQPQLKLKNALTYLACVNDHGDLVINSGVHGGGITIGDAEMAIALANWILETFQ